jgi:hypothetical protein
MVHQNLREEVDERPRPYAVVEVPARRERLGIT